MKHHKKHHKHASSDIRYANSRGDMKHLSCSSTMEQVLTHSRPQWLGGMSVVVVEKEEDIGSISEIMNQADGCGSAEPCLLVVLLFQCLKIFW